MNWIDELLEELDDAQDCRDTFEYLVWEGDECRYNVDDRTENRLLRMLSDPMTKRDMIDVLAEIEPFKITYRDPMRMNQTQRAKWIASWI